MRRKPRTPGAASSVSQTLLEPKAQAVFLRKLLAWYAKEGRHDMPWRKTRDPYAIVVSEFMLQQTTVGTVRPYYERFLKRFPTGASLAASDLNDVLALWSGLGYYARARNLWLALRAVQETHKGKVPSAPEDLMKLPGVGPYTAGAIAAFAFNKPAPVLDGNIYRVLMRLLAIEDDPKLKAVQVVLKKVSLDLAKLALKTGKAERGGPRDLNLALMDLGATVCVPQGPKCGDCPAATLCLARSYGRQEEIPIKTEKLERPTLRRVHAALAHQGKWLVGQRPRDGLFGGLWEFPGVDISGGTEPVLHLEETLGRELGLSFRVRQAVPAFEHQLTHRILLVRAYVCDLSKGVRPPVKLNKTANYQRFKWVTGPQLDRMGISSITKKTLAEVLRVLNSEASQDF